jgi:hypothetical protein
MMKVRCAWCARYKQPGRNTTTVLVEGRVQCQGQLVFVLGQTTQHTNSSPVKKRKRFKEPLLLIY